MPRLHDPNLLDVMMSYGIDPRARRIYLHHEMERDEEPGKNTVEHVVRGLQYLDKTDGHIELWINTPGGSVPEMFGIYDVIRSLRHEVWTIGFGQIASAGGLILVAGDKRYATPTARFMAHAEQVCFPEPTDFYEAQAVMRAYEREIKLWLKLMGERTKRSAAWWLEQIKTRREVHLSAPEMKRLGVVNDVWPTD